MQIKKKLKSLIKSKSYDSHLENEIYIYVYVIKLEYSILLFNIKFFVCSLGIHRITNYFFHNLCFPRDISMLRLSMGSRSRSNNHFIWNSYVLRLHLLEEEA